MKKRRSWVIFVAGGLIFLAGAVYLARLPLLRAYTIYQVEKARQDGIFATPEEGMTALVRRTYENISRIDIDRAGANSFSGQQPHVWFVSAKVYADRRGDGRRIGPEDYDYPGSFFLHVEDGWVHLPEGAFPKLVGLGMEKFELYGCDKQTGNCG